MGSLCCVAVRPHGTSTASREWSSIDRSDPQTNAGFSPPLSRWEYRINSEGLSYGSPGESGVAANYGSSLSSNSKEPSRSWERSELPQVHRYSISEGATSYFNSPDICFQNHHIMLPMAQDSSVDEYLRGIYILDLQKSYIVLMLQLLLPRFKHAQDCSNPTFIHLYFFICCASVQ
jgi:hypothetical protein